MAGCTVTVKVRQEMVRVLGVGIFGIVTGEAFGGSSCIALELVALFATRQPMPSGQREIRLVVVNLGGSPAVGRVTDLAVVGEVAGGMVRVVCPFEVHLMTRPAIARQTVKLASRMARRAISGSVSAGQREIGRLMVEGGGLPGVGGMASGAVVVELALRMAGRFDLLEISTMTGKAIGCRAGKLAVDMALCTVGRPMRSGQWEGRLLVVEGRWLPSSSRVALQAVVIELTLDVVRLLNISEILRVTGVTVERRSIKTGRMAGFTRGGEMRSIERKASLIMVYPCRLPAVHGVTGGAVVVVRTGDVARIGYSLESGAVAVETDGRGVVVTGGVTGGAIYGPVRTDQREMGLLVVDGRRLPASGGVAGSTVMVVIA